MDSQKYFFSSVDDDACKGLSKSFKNVLYNQYIEEDGFAMDAEEYALTCTELTDFAGVNGKDYPFDPKNQKSVDNFLKAYQKDLTIFKESDQPFAEDFKTSFEQFKKENEKELKKLTSDDVALQIVFTIHNIVNSVCSVGEDVEMDEW